MREEIKNRLEVVIDDLFVELHEKYGTKSGDIDFYQALEVENLTNKMADVITSQIEQNLD